MKRRSLLKSAGALSVLPFGMASLAATNPLDQKKEFYELRKYTFNFRDKRGALNSYLEKAVIPSLNKHGVQNVGVFMERGETMPTNMYVLVPYPSMEDFMDIRSKMQADKEFQKLSADYQAIPLQNKAFKRYETSLLSAFDGIPKMELPKSKKRVFELRTYEGYSEDAVRRKVKMFNDEELTLFYKVKLNPVFFGEIIAGPQMPALTYMLWFEDYEAREKNWKAFLDHPDWKKMLPKPEYKDTVADISRVFLEPTDYSQI